MNEMMARLAAFLIVCSVAMTGCLSLGGRTTYMQESKETQNRIFALEARMERLEGLMTPEPMSPSAMRTASATETLPPSRRPSPSHEVDAKDPPI